MFERSRVFGEQTRRHLLGTSIVAAGAATFGGSLPAGKVLASQGTPAAATPSTDPADIQAMVESLATELGFKAVIYRVVQHGQEVVTNAIGESMTGIPATTDLLFRNGAVAIGYLSTLLLILVDEGVIGLDDPIAQWQPDLPDADKVTPRMLISMTSGYPDYVPDATFDKDLYLDPFQVSTAQERIEIGLHTLPRSFAPGTNWDYSHTGIVILGQVIESVTGQKLGDLLQSKVYDPLGLRHTYNIDTAEIPGPALHAFTSERRSTLGIAEDVPFYEESTYWNPSWTLAPGSVTLSDITDMTTVALDWANGSLLTPESHKEQITPLPDGFGSIVEGCRACHPLDNTYNYALGLIYSNGWLVQNPLFYGYSAVTGVLPEEELAIAVAATFAPDGFTASGDYRTDSRATTVMKAIAKGFTSTPPLLG